MLLANMFKQNSSKKVQLISETFSEAISEQVQRKEKGNIQKKD